jgi:hypothetical protein
MHDEFDEAKAILKTAISWRTHAEADLDAFMNQCAVVTATREKSEKALINDLLAKLGLKCTEFEIADRSFSRYKTVYGLFDGVVFGVGPLYPGGTREALFALKVCSECGRDVPSLPIERLAHILLFEQGRHSSTHHCPVDPSNVRTSPEDRLIDAIAEIVDAVAADKVSEACNR